MGSKGKWVRRSAGEQRAMLARFETSGLAAEAFCRREGVSTGSLYRWRAVHGGQALARSEGAASKRAPSFVDLGPLRLPTSRGGRLEVKLELGEGLVLHLVRG